MLVSLIFFALTLCALLLWLWLKLRANGYRKHLLAIEQELSSINVHTSDQQLAKRGYFHLISEKTGLQTKVAQCKNNQRAVLVITGILLVVAIVSLLTDHHN